MQSRIPKPKRQHTSDRDNVNWPATAAGRGSLTSGSVAVDAGTARKSGGKAATPLLLKSLEQALPRFRSLTGLLATDGKPQDDRILRFVERLIPTGVAGERASATELETRFFNFLDAGNANKSHAIYLSDDKETTLLGHMTLRELSKLLEVNL